MSRYGLLFAAICVAYFPKFTHAHGRMLIPPSRMSGYLAGLRMPPNYNDHEMNCGGREVQWDQSGGKCGICGEPWPGKKNYERPDGIMAQHNIKTATYLENDVIRIRLQITVSHRGWHQFSICNVATSGGVEATQACLDRMLLADEKGNTRFYNGTTSTGFFEFFLVLPPRFTCNHCVIQWKWKCGNDWGCDAENRCCVGCGDRQEEFYACSDVTINPRNMRDQSTQPTLRTTSRRYSSTVPRRTTSPTYTTRPQRVTYQPRTTAPTRRTTSTTRATTTTTRRTAATTKSTANSGYHNMAFAYLRRFYNIARTDASVPFPGEENDNNHPNGNSRNAFMNMVLGRNSVVVDIDDLSVPIPMVNNSSPSCDINTEIANDNQTKYRFCAACFYGTEHTCSADDCHKYCPELPEWKTTPIKNIPAWHLWRKGN